MLTVSRRTILVLGSLTMAMTLTSLLLLVLEPSGRALGQIGNLRSLMVATPDGQEVPIVRDTSVPLKPEQWREIHIGFTGSGSGTAEDMDRHHRSMGLQGLADHFVLLNGRPTGDGHVAVGYRWKDQIAAARISAQGSTSLGSAVKVAIVGDPRRSPMTEAQFESLVELVRQLQAALSIPPEHVLVEEGWHFAEEGKFRSQLLRPAY
ncbi:MAG: N-acetylmuramoyl-L-alanine amidase [Phycisphaeraceae bacterium]|nr:N-acetylmuramoyl-L-alanine amidase [Phycisphaeraceae bacterium]